VVLALAKGPLTWKALLEAVAAPDLRKIAGGIILVMDPGYSTPSDDAVLDEVLLHAGDIPTRPGKQVRTPFRLCPLFPDS